MGAIVTGSDEECNACKTHLWVPRMKRYGLASRPSDGMVGGVTHRHKVRVSCVRVATRKSALFPVHCTRRCWSGSPASEPDHHSPAPGDAPNRRRVPGCDESIRGLEDEPRRRACVEGLRAALRDTADVLSVCGSRWEEGSWR